MLKRYSEYKDSGIEWIGQVPKDWAIKRLKFVADINPSRLPDMADETQCVFIPMEAMNSDGTFDQYLRRPVSELKTGFTCFSKDDVIFAKITPCFENGKGALLAGLTTEIGFGSTEFHVLRMRKGKTISRFLYYLSVSGAFRRLGEAFMQGVAGQKRVTNDFVCDFVAGVPSLSEQEKIADFLDRKTEQIDDLIAKKERMIELLKEERAAAINQAVTKGLDSTVEMKDSGIEWLGKIPKHWKIGKTRFSFFVVSGNGFPDELQGKTDGEYPFYKVSDINLSGTNVSEANNYVSKDDILTRRWKVIPKGSILLAKIGAALAKNHRKMSLVNCLIDNNMMAVTPSDANGHLKYYYYLMSVIQMEWFSNPGAVPSVDMNRFRSFSVPNIEHEEQKAIADYLDQKLAQIDSHVTREKNSIELLKEYRISLISEVVTGKIDVRSKVHA